ncbi:helix-turn-helix transcriptional regulator [Gracilibacillus oryzae]|uniref:helix-turn-helix transcriptional regulator n=1 Tax=Gracilibacillus oryzae TaxID=1672701 RepID=UPI001886411E|nr:YafY family protein [Gracilibacillus oryzae]
MSKAVRLNELRLYINRVKKFKVNDLAKEFNVSRRTILRDLEELSISGVPLISEVGVNGGYQVLEEKNLLSVSFTKEETFSIFFALTSLKHFMSLPFESEYESIIRKFYLNLNGLMKDEIDSIKNRVDFQIDNQSEEVPFLKELFMAAVENEPLCISYKGVRRDVQPIGLYSRYGRWYCPSYCYLRKDYRLFRCDHISELEITDREDKIKIEVNNLSDIISSISQEKEYELVVQLSPTGVKKYQSNSWPNSNLVESNGQAVVYGSISETDVDFLADYFIYLREDAKVIQPVELVDEIKKRISVLRGLYE